MIWLLVGRVLPLWKIWWTSQLNGQIQHVPKHQPDGNGTVWLFNGLVWGDLMVMGHGDLVGYTTHMPILSFIGYKDVVSRTCLWTHPIQHNSAACRWNSHLQGRLLKKNHNPQPLFFFQLPNRGWSPTTRWNSSLIMRSNTSESLKRNPKLGHFQW